MAPLRGVVEFNQPETIPMNYEDFCHEGAIPSILINNKCALTKAQTLKVLKSIRTAIARGDELVLDNSEEIGAKHTHCNWGMCTNLPEHYPDPRMHKFPKDFVENGNVNPLRWPTGHGCPMYTKRKTRSHHGCFYCCRAFGGSVNREQALALYDEAISELENS
jgi:hypothetical protein